MLAVRVMQDGETEKESFHWFASIGKGKGREGGRMRNSWNCVIQKELFLETKRAPQ